MTDFQQDVLTFLRTIPRGFVVTYSMIAEHLGGRHLCRAVGSALHRNPDGEYYPCYKVVNAKGQLSPHYAFGGIAEQKRRLEAEGIKVDNGKVDLKKYLYRYQP